VKTLAVADDFDPDVLAPRSEQFLGVTRVVEREPHYGGIILVHMNGEFVQFLVSRRASFAAKQRGGRQSRNAGAENRSAIHSFLRNLI
jgi:hypothetical protein